MRRRLPKYSRVTLTTDRFADLGASRGAVGYVIEVWPGGKYEVEVSDSTGITIAQFVADDDELELDPQSVDPTPTA